MRRSYRFAAQPCHPTSSVSGLLARSRERSPMEVSMSIARRLLVAPLIMLMATAAPSFADQRHLVDPSQLAAAVGEHAARQDADRAAVREALDRAEVKDVA